MPREHDNYNNQQGSIMKFQENQPELPRSGSFHSSSRSSLKLSSRDKRCCCCLSLQRGVKFIIIWDIFSLVSQLLTLSAVLIWQLKDADVLNLSEGKHFVFWMSTSGILEILLLTKCWYGVKFLYFSSFAYEAKIHRKYQLANAGINAGAAIVSVKVVGPESQEQVTHRARKTVLKGQRRQLNHFFITSTVYYIFLMILVLCLVPILIAVNLIENLKPDTDSDSENPAQIKFTDLLLFMLVFALLSVISLLYLVKRINWLLIEKDEELRYRSMKIGDDDVLQKQKSGGAKSSPFKAVDKQGSKKQVANQIVGGIGDSKEYEAALLDKNSSDKQTSSRGSYKNRNQLF
ncbi:hypothetical protein FGO68_gene7993 [Halteria grandinella]|uniref:Uncharacterized protein n=1 Tax=Halteria grandinella TaxID=5974 RepID=A0A8J8NN81_HALGN|nr:hypothetical protein FGO68_gene7993 [Halteria grandinella]